MSCGSSFFAHQSVYAEYASSRRQMLAVNAGDAGLSEPDQWVRILLRLLSSCQHLRRPKLPVTQVRAESFEHPVQHTGKFVTDDPLSKRHVFATDEALSEGNFAVPGPESILTSVNQRTVVRGDDQRV